MLIIGSELLQRPDGDNLLSAAMRIADSASATPEWKVLNILQKVTNQSFLACVQKSVCFLILMCPVYREGGREGGRDSLQS